jgi:hypothetical protein
MKVDKVDRVDKIDRVNKVDRINEVDEVDGVNGVNRGNGVDRVNSRALATLLGPLIPKVGETSLSTERSLSTFAKINLFFVCNHHLNWKLIIAYLDNFM